MDTVKLLLRDDHGETALFRTAAINHEDIVDLLRSERAAVVF